MLVYSHTMSELNDEASELFFGSSSGEGKQVSKKRPYSGQVNMRDHNMGFSKKRITADQYARQAHAEQLYLDYANMNFAERPTPTPLPYDHRLNPYQALERQTVAPHSHYNIYDHLPPVHDIIGRIHHVDKSQGRKWTPEEDDILRKGVEFFAKQKKQIDFNSIIANLPSRSVKQAKERWGNCLNPEITKGEWTNDEIKELLTLIAEHGPQWTVIQRNLVSRSMHCIKSKGRKLLGESLNKRARKLVGAKPVNKYWTEEEQKNLLKFHTIYHYDFEQICLELAKQGFCRPPAQVDRQLLATCPCKSCKTRKNALTDADESLKILWTKAKATALLMKM
uniref:Myb-like domain-containing protein n=1 Tax=Aplanochytrium stocchinoi TaxID=215587 RepID=A0A7S3PFX3_9STRA|mmetsp:Transcript_30858/g.38093  ORF Transcript_30858/g.38093 Transcript_30858/m.38093 type:complete len:337 (+) Transcript_30858:236-1246(+)